MDHLLVYGIDTVAGANIAATLSDRYQVTGISETVPVTIEGCKCLENPKGSTNAAEQLILTHQPSWIIHCGPAASSTWFEANNVDDSIIDETKSWAKAAAHHEIPLTVLSSDAVHTGPWMFHEENGETYCDSKSASFIRKMETAVSITNPSALIVRTNVFGWTPESNNEGWIEQILETMDENQVHEIDAQRTATPILASDLAVILDRARSEHLTGLFHIAGAERVTPLQFVRKLADQFDAAWLTEMTCRRTSSAIESRPLGFGCGESSLQTKKVRKALCVAMPMLSEGLERLHAQCYSGYREGLNSESSLSLQSRAA